MKKLINLLKYYFNISFELELTIFDIFIIMLTFIWAIVLTLAFPRPLNCSLFIN